MNNLEIVRLKNAVNERDHVSGSLFDEHVTGTPTFYINEVRYTGTTDVESLLAAIKQADTEGRIWLPEPAGRIRKVFGRWRRGTHG